MPRCTWLLAFALLGCADDECTLIGCDDTSVVSFPPGLVVGPYDLVIDAEVGQITARCLQPAAPEAADNPPELDCDREGFTITGGDFARMRELQVTVIDVANEETLASATVPADVVDEQSPNGPECPPTCFVRNGALQATPAPD